MAKALTNYLDSLLGDPQKRYMMKHYPMQLDFLGEYPDFAALIFVMSIACNYEIYLTNNNIKNNNTKKIFMTS